MSLQKISESDWQSIQEVELATWTPTGWTDPATGKTYSPFPTFEGKLEREQGYQRQMIARFGINRLSGILLDIGCGPSPLSDQIESTDLVRIAIDPLIPGYAQYHNVFAWKALPLAAPAEHIPLPANFAQNIVSTNALDHFQDPNQALDEMVRLLKPLGCIYLSFCINNASEGHPHPAHKIDLTGDQVTQYLKGRMVCESGYVAPYGWREQPAWFGVYRKYA